MKRWGLGAGMGAIALVAGTNLPVYADAFDQQFDINPSETIGTARESADQLVSRGNQAAAAGQWDAAIALWRESLDLYAQIGDQQSLGTVYKYLGLTYARLERFPEADDALRRQVAIAHDLQDYQNEIEGLNNIGTIALQRGILPEARDLFWEAMLVAQRIESGTGRALSQGNLGRVAAAEGKYDEAIHWYEESLALLASTNEPAVQNSILLYMGEAYLGNNQPRNALGSYQSALQLANVRGDRNSQILAIDGLISVYNKLEQTASVLDLLQQRLVLARNAQDVRQQLISTRALAQFYQQAGEWEPARLYYREAIALARALQDTRQEQELVNRLIGLGL